MLRTETLVTITEAKKLFPGNPDISTVWRWCCRGVRGCRLESMLIGGKRMTSAEACERFLGELQRNDAERAERELIRDGV